MWVVRDPCGRLSPIASMLRPLMRRLLVALSLVAPVLIATPARAEDDAPPPAEVPAAAVEATPEGDIPKDLPRLLLDNGRAEMPRPEPDVYRFTLHGE